MRLFEDLPFYLIQEAPALDRALEQWKSCAMLGVDIECSLTGVHRCTLALIQISDGERVWILDPLALPDRIPEALEAMSDASWVVQDFSGDGIVFKRIYNFVPSSVFDTFLLAKALGYPQPGLKTMAQLKLGLALPKEEQDSNWLMRPLRPAQIEYAARDAAVMLPLLKALAQEAEDRQGEPEVAARLSLLPKETRRLLDRIRNYRPQAMDPLVLKASKAGLSPLAQKRIHQLAELRVRWANEGDIAAMMEMGNRWCLSQLQHPPQSLEALAKRIPNPRFRKRRLQELWEMLKPE